MTLSKSEQSTIANSVKMNQMTLCAPVSILILISLHFLPAITTPKQKKTTSYLQCSNIKSLCVLLATSLVIVGDNILPDVLLLKHYQWLLLLTPQCDKQHHYCCQREIHTFPKIIMGAVIT